MRNLVRNSFCTALSPPNNNNVHVYGHFIHSSINTFLHFFKLLYYSKTKVISRVIINRPHSRCTHKEFASTNLPNVCLIQHCNSREYAAHHTVPTMHELFSFMSHITTETALKSSLKAVTGRFAFRCTATAATCS
jgi:hypothetical protein